LKRAAQRLIQRAIGLDAYLDLFARYRLFGSRWDSRDAAFRAFLARLPADGLVLDVGANVGVMTVGLSRHVDRGRVHSFEPNPACFGAAERLVKRLGLTNVALHNWALGRLATEVDMVMPVANAVRMHGLSRVATSAGPGGDHFRTAVRVLDAMDELFTTEARVTGMKIDVEDSESEVIEGAQRLLAQHRPLVYCELWLTPNRDRTVALMRSLGYAALVYRKGALEPFEPWPHASVQDFFFVPGTGSSVLLP
jgi:FkbM family methyltransferase